MEITQLWNAIDAHVTSVPGLRTEVLQCGFRSTPIGRVPLGRPTALFRGSRLFMEALYKLCTVFIFFIVRKTTGISAATICADPPPSLIFLRTCTWQCFT